MIDRETISRFARIGPLPKELNRMVPQEGVRHDILPPDTEHNAIWDYMLSPDGRHYFSVCAEGSFSQFARLYEYLPQTGVFRLCFKLEDAITTYPRAIRPSKLHSSFSFMPDGRLIMATHTTATAPGHPEWMPYAYYDHQWEGFQGSNLLIYDPATGRVEDLGIPVSRTSIYGGVYEPTSNAYYFGDYLRGHVYRFDLSNRHVKDYGQATEVASFRFIVGPDHHVYFSTKSGRFMRINTQLDAIEDLNAEFPVYDDIPLTLLHNQMVFAAIGPDGKLYISAAYGRELLRYDFSSGALEPLGVFLPPDFQSVPWGSVMAAGVTFDKEGVLWYVFFGDTGCWLVSWDVLRGGTPRNHGLIGSPERRIGYSSEIHIQDDILYAADSNHGYDPPGIFSVRLDTLRGRGPSDLPCADAYHYIRLINGAEQYGGDLGVDAERHYVKDLLRNERSERFFNVNTHVFDTPRRFLTKIWRHVPIETSAVHRVWYDELGNVHAICGECGEHHIVLREGKVLSIDAERGDAPARTEAGDLFAGIALPARPGRQYLATASASAPLSGGRYLVGTRDGMLAVVRDGRAFALGACAPHGPVHQIVSTKDGRTAYGVAGDRDDMGTVFTYDDENGLTIFGRVFINTCKSVGGLGASCEPCCLALSGDDRMLAIGARDRMGCVYEYDLSEGFKPTAIP